METAKIQNLGGYVPQIKKEGKTRQSVMSDEDEPSAKQAVDISVKDEDGTCNKIVRSTVRLALESEQFKSTREECNDTPLSPCICQVNSQIDSQSTLEAAAESEAQKKPKAKSKPKTHSNLPNGGRTGQYLANSGPYSQLMTQADLEEIAHWEVIRWQTGGGSPGHYLANSGPYSRLIEQGKLEKRARGPYKKRTRKEAADR